MAAYNTSVRDWTIYKITNPKGRVYIGKSCTYEARVRCYKSDFGKNQPLIRNSFIKYGFEAHVFDKLDEFKSDCTYACGKEIFWIRSYMSNHQKYPEQNGMNLTDGGEGTLGYKKSEIEKAAMSLRTKGRKHTEEWKRANAERMKGNKHSLGVKPSAETREKLRLAGIGRVYSKESISKLRQAACRLRGKPIIQMDLEGNMIKEFASISDARRELRCHSIGRVCQGLQKQAGGFKFKYKT